MTTAWIGVRYWLPASYDCSVSQYCERLQAPGASITQVGNTVKIKGTVTAISQSWLLPNDQYFIGIRADGRDAFCAFDSVDEIPMWLVGVGDTVVIRGEYYGIVQDMPGLKHCKVCQICIFD